MIITTENYLSDHFNAIAQTVMDAIAPQILIVAKESDEFIDDIKSKYQWSKHSTVTPVAGISAQIALVIVNNSDQFEEVAKIVSQNNTYIIAYDIDNGIDIEIRKKFQEKTINYIAAMSMHYFRAHVRSTLQLKINCLGEINKTVITLNKHRDVLSKIITVLDKKKSVDVLVDDFEYFIFYLSFVLKNTVYENYEVLRTGQDPLPTTNLSINFEKNKGIDIPCINLISEKNEDFIDATKVGNQLDDYILASYAYGVAENFESEINETKFIQKGDLVKIIKHYKDPISIHNEIKRILKTAELKFRNIPPRMEMPFGNFKMVDIANQLESSLYSAGFAAVDNNIDNASLLLGSSRSTLQSKQKR